MFFLFALLPGKDGLVGKALPLDPRRCFDQQYVLHPHDALWLTPLGQGRADFSGAPGIYGN